MNTYADCVIKAKELNISARRIAQAFGIMIPITAEEVLLLTKLKRAKTQKTRWKIYKSAPIGSDQVEIEALHAILDNATDREEIWEVYNVSFHLSVKKEALQMILTKLNNQDSRYQLLSSNRAGHEGYDQIILDILKHTKCQEERWSLAQQHTTTRSKIREVVLQAILDNATTKEEIKKVCDNSVSESEVNKAAIRALCS